MNNNLKYQLYNGKIFCDAPNALSLSDINQDDIDEATGKIYAELMPYIQPIVHNRAAYYQTAVALRKFVSGCFDPLRDSQEKARVIFYAAGYYGFHMHPRAVFRRNDEDLHGCMIAVLFTVKQPNQITITFFVQNMSSSELRQIEQMRYLEDDNFFATHHGTIQSPEVIAIYNQLMLKQNKPNHGMTLSAPVI